MITYPELFTFMKCEWKDIVMIAGWQDSDKTVELSGPHSVISYGWLTYVGDDYIIMSSTKSSNGPDQYNNHASIPKGRVVSISEGL